MMVIFTQKFYSYLFLYILKSCLENNPHCIFNRSVKVPYSSIQHEIYGLLVTEVRNGQTAQATILMRYKSDKEEVNNNNK